MRALTFRVLLLLLATSVQAWATTYYSDFINGSDTNNGTSTATPWQRLPGMQSASGVANATTLNPGDIVCFNGNRTWTNLFTAASGVTYASSIGETAPCNTWGTGYATIEVPTASASMAIWLRETSDNAVIDGFIGINHYITSAARCGILIGGINGNLVTGVIVKNSKATQSLNGICITGYADSITIQKSEFYANTGDVSLANCNSSGIDVANSGLVSVNVTNILIQNVILHDNGKTCFSSGINEGRGITIENTGSGLTFRDSLIYNNGDPAGEQGSGIEGAYFDNVLIERVYQRSGNTAVEVKSNSNGWIFRGNVFVGSSSGVFQYGYDPAGGDSINSTITHNTIVSTSNLSNAGMKLLSPGTGMIVRDNTVILPNAATGAGIEMNRNGTSWAMSTWDNNFSNNAVVNGQSFTVESFGSFTTRTVAGHQAAYPNQAQNSVSFTAPTGTPSRLAFDFRPKSTSLLCNAGSKTVPIPGTYYNGQRFGPSPTIGALACGP